MRLDHLDYISTIAKYRSISKAARELYVSQPALTMYLNKLEDELGVKLFNRAVTPIQLTCAGACYLKYAGKILEIEEQMEKEFEEITLMKRGKLTVGIPNVRGAYWLPKILPPFLGQYPGIDVNIIEGNSDFLEAKILSGDIDVSIYTLPVKSLEIGYEVIADDRILLAIPKGHPALSGIEDADGSLINPLFIDAGRMDGVPMIELTPEQGMYRTARQICELYGIRPISMMQIKNCETACRLAAAGVAPTFVPECCAIALKNMVRQPVYCTLSLPVFTRKLVAAYKKDGCLSLAARKFIEMTKEIVNSDPELCLK